jgi:hypothetical protein
MKGRLGAVSTGTERNPGLQRASLKVSEAILLKLLAGEAKLRETVLKVGR